MDSHLQKSRFLRSRGLKAGLGKAARVAASAGLVIGLFGPMPFSPWDAPTTAEGKDLEWGDLRPPMTDLADTVETDGFRHLPSFGQTTHPIVVAPNGDVFTVGTGAEVNTHVNAAADPVGDTDCDDATDADADTTAADGDCDVAADVAPVVFKSTDGGLSWRSVRLPIVAVAAGATISAYDIVVSPKYPNDDFVAVVFNSGTAASVENGICWSDDSGQTFTTATGAANCLSGGDAVPGAMDDILWRAIALSGDFDWNNSNGTIAIGGTWVAGATSTVYTGQVSAIKGSPAGADFIATTDIAAVANDAADVTLHLAYAVDQEPIALARLVVDGAGTKTYAHVMGTSSTWPALAGTELLDDNATSFVASHGQVRFDDDYETGGMFYAAAGTLVADATASNSGVGGVFRFSSGWTERTFIAGEFCDRAMGGLSIAGNGSDVTLVASALDDNTVCSSTNAGSTWDDAETDGGDSVFDGSQIASTSAVTMLALRRSEPSVVYHTTSVAKGGVTRSTDTGAGWQDTGLVNDPVTASTILESTTSRVFAAAGNDLFQTKTYGTGAGYWRVHRGGSGANLSLASDFETSGTAYIWRGSTKEKQVLKSTDGGNSFKHTTRTPLSNENLSTASVRSTTTVYVGGEEGSVAYTVDGGGSWTKLAKDFGDKVDEFDFKSETVFFVTAVENNTMKIWLTTDGGANFTQVGDAPWGTQVNTAAPGQNGAFTTDVNKVDASGKGTIIAVAQDQQTNGVYRYDTSGTSLRWVDTDIPATSWKSVNVTSVPGVGDGHLWLFWDSATGSHFRTWDLLSIKTESDWDDARVTTQAPAGLGGDAAVSVGTSKGPAGSYTIQVTHGGRVQEYTFTAPFQAMPIPTSPVDKSSVPSNVGDEGIPSVFRWNSVGKAACYEIQISLEPNFTAPPLDPTGTGIAAGDCDAGGAGVTAKGVSTGSAYQIDKDIFSLVVGQSYHWRVRVRATDSSLAAGVVNPGPWSAVQSFSVSTTSNTVVAPQPQLPQDGSPLPNLGPTQFSFNLPAGTVQYHIQIMPLNNDGPGIDHIEGKSDVVASASFTSQPPVMGSGNYIMLPGATYTWRVRVTNKAGSLTSLDPSWGPWSVIRTFRTPKPSAASITLNAVTPSATPTLSWKDSITSNFYYEVQLSQDKTFTVEGPGISASVYWNLIHAGETDPLYSWKTPAGLTLEKGKTYYWRVRQRVQATPNGAEEVGVAWSQTASFMVP